MTKKKIRYLLSKHSVKDVDVYSMLKEFFKEFLQAKYEFTFQELHEELKKVYLDKAAKDAIVSLIDSFSTIEYQDDVIPQEHLRGVIKQFDSVIDKLIPVEEKSGFLSKIFKSNRPSLDSKSPALGSRLDSVSHSQKSELETTKTVTPSLSTSQTKEVTQAPTQVTSSPSSSQLDNIPVRYDDPVQENQESMFEDDTSKELPQADQSAAISVGPRKNWQQAVHDKPSITPHELSWAEEQKNQDSGKLSDFAIDAGQVNDTNESSNIIIPATDKSSSSQHVSQPPQEHPGASVDLSSLADELNSLKGTPDVNALIDQVKASLESNNSSHAKGKYKELLGHYNSLSEEEKVPYFERIQHLYESLKQS